MVIVSLLVTITLGASSNDGPIALGTEKQLFLDDYVLAERQDLDRRVHPAAKYPGNPVLWPEEPWEGAKALVYGSVIRDGDRFRMWHYSGPGVSYAESGDGIHWEKPKLGVIALEGHDTNVLILRDANGTGEIAANPFFYEVFGVHKDPRAADPAKRYVMGYLSLARDYSGPRQDPFHGSQRRGLGVMHSADGIHWTQTERWASEAICDGATHWMFDPKRNRYVLFGRTKFAPPEVKEAWKEDAWAARYFWGRAVARIESSDFLDWDYKDPATAPVVMAPDIHDPPGTEIYSMMVFPYESLYIGLVQRFHNRPGDVFLDVQLAVSHDSIHFERVDDRSPFLPCGPVGTWDRFNQAVANNPPIEMGDELRFYYSGRTYRHGPYDGPDKGVSGGGIGFATVPRDRFVSLSASFDGGHLITKPLLVQGDTLHLNGVSRFGEITVEVLASTGDILATSTPIREDALDIAIEWKEPFTFAKEQPVQLRISLKNALLFALWAT